MNYSRIYLSCIFILSAHCNAEGFLEDSSLSISTKNYYLDRKFSDFTALPGAQDWAQGIIVKYQSGYSSGVIGFGLDIHSLTSIKLRGNSDYLASGLLPADPVSREREDTASEVGFTAKIKYQDNEIKLGTISPFNPVIFGSVSRLLPQTFRGVSFDSKAIKKLDVSLGYVDQVNHRDSTNFEDLTTISFNGRFRSASSDQLLYLGGKYNFNPQTHLGLYHVRIDDIYDQSALSFRHQSQLKHNLNLITDIRAWHSDNSGQALAGDIDNSLVTANLGFKYNHHTVTLSGMHNYGDTAHPYLSGGEVLIFIDGWSTDFLNPKEKVYSIRYDYDFKNYVPGLKFMTRYIKGSDINLPNLGGSHLEEDAFDFDLQYTFQSGRLKGLGLRGRHSIYDNDFAQSASFKPARETRINVDYTWTF